MPGGVTVRLPLVALAPVQPAPLAAHAVAFLLDQFKLTHQPDEMAVGDAVSVTVGMGIAGVTVTVALACAVPPEPVQVRR